MIWLRSPPSLPHETRDRGVNRAADYFDNCITELERTRDEFVVGEFALERRKGPCVVAVAASAWATVKSTPVAKN
jgi:hypothetical protein